MSNDSDYTASFTVPRTPQQVFDAITNVRGWWSEDIEGRTDKLGASFTFRSSDQHRSTHKITELVPGKRVVWHTTASQINFVKDKGEWNGTDVVFDIVGKADRTELRFTHVGLRPTIECYDGCSDAWSFFVKTSLRNLVTTGAGQPDKQES